jgi:hypothetical protein
MRTFQVNSGTAKETPGPKAISSIARQLALSQMMLFAIRIERALDVTVQRPHDADASHHSRAARRRDQDQGFHCVLPFHSLMLGFRKLDDVGSGVLDCDEAVGY